MPVYLPKSNTLFLHVPKTGGQWVRAALTSAKIEWHAIADPVAEHYDYKQCKDIHPCAKRFTVLRNPFGWYSSFWAYRMIYGWGGDFRPGHTCAANTLEEFVTRMYHHHRGYLYGLYEKYAQPDVTILHTEQLANELVIFLARNGERFDEGDLRNTPRANEAATTPKYKLLAKHNWMTRALIQASEVKTFTRYGFEQNLKLE